MCCADDLRKLFPDILKLFRTLVSLDSSNVLHTCVNGRKNKKKKNGAKKTYMALLVRDSARVTACVVVIDTLRETAAKLPFPSVAVKLDVGCAASSLHGGVHSSHS